MAVGWILHHEVAHVVLDHHRAHPAQTIRQEVEADEYAVKCTFDACPNTLARTKRELGMTIALLAMQFLDDPGADTYIATHPPTSERIFACLNRAGVDPDGPAYALAAIGMHFHLGQHGIRSELDGDSFQSILDDALANFRTSGRRLSA